METAETYFGKINSPEARKRIKNRANIRKRTQSSKILQAYINHGRWVVNCPFCNNAEFYWGDGFFFCSECENRGNGGRLYLVSMPKERNRIEKLLAKRPIENQNWFPDEPISKLEEENKEHGVM